jgi:multiple sugar transport system permease protein
MTAVPSRVAARRQPARIRAAQTRAAWILVIPFLVIFAAFFIVPLVYSLYISLYSSQLVGGEVFTGFGNYARALQDPAFWGGLGRVAQFLVIQVPIMLVASRSPSTPVGCGAARSCGCSSSCRTRCPASSPR